MLLEVLKEGEVRFEVGFTKKGFLALNQGLNKISVKQSYL